MTNKKDCGDEKGVEMKCTGLLTATLAVKRPPPTKK
jgi:hypothetical protein